MGILGAWRYTYMECRFRDGCLLIFTECYNAKEQIILKICWCWSIFSSRTTTKLPGIPQALCNHALHGLTVALQMSFSCNTLQQYPHIIFSSIAIPFNRCGLLFVIKSFFFFYWSEWWRNAIQRKITDTAYMSTYTIFRHIKVQSYIKESRSVASFNYNNWYIFLYICNWRISLQSWLCICLEVNVSSRLALSEAQWQWDGRVAVRFERRESKSLQV